jgi:dihydropteroate synthase
LLRGASMVRVHEVPATVRAIEVCDRVLAAA